MPKKRWVVLVAVQLLWLPVTAQTIRVVNSDGAPISAAQLFAIDKNPVRVLFSNDRGEVNAEELTAGDRLVFRCLGYLSDTLVFDPGTDVYTVESARYDLDEVLITAQYQPIPLHESVLMARTIGEGEIRQRAAVNLRDLLENEINFRVSRDQVLGSGLSMQGLGGQNVKIMIDGVPVIGRLDGNVDISQINLHDIRRVEIIEGPLAVNYGSNALAGTINLITKAPKANSLTAGADFFTESSGTFNTTLHTSLGFDKQSVAFSGGRKYFDGWNPGDATFYHRDSRIADSSRVKLWNPREQWFADAKYRRNFERGYAEVAGHWFDEEIVNRGGPRGAYGETALDDLYHTRRYGVSGKFQWRLNHAWSTHHVLAYNVYERTKSTYFTDLTGVTSELSANEDLQDTSVFTGALARGSFIGDLGESLGVQIGYEIEIESAEGKRILDDAGRIDNFALFATSEWKPVKRFTVKPGLRWGYNSRYDAPLIPSLNLLYDFPGDFQTRLSYAQGFRAPGLKELSFFFVDVNHNIRGNNQLQAERSHNVSLSISANEGQRRKIGWKASGYYNRVSNLITLANESTTLYQYVNIGRQETVGGQLQAQTKFGDLGLSAAVAYTGLRSNPDGLDDDPDFLFSPEATLRAGYTFGNTGISGNLIYKFNGRQHYYLTGEEGSVTSGYIREYHSMDVSFSRRFWQDRLSVQCGAKNLFDVQNLPASTGGGTVHGGSQAVSIGTGRTYFLQVGLALSKKDK